MPLNQTNKLAWIVETISKAGRITFEELSQRWVDNDDLSQGKPMQKRTFHKWRQSIWDTFGLDIQCDQSGAYRYYIANPEDLREGTLEQWLVSTLSVSNAIAGSRSLKERILLEDVPSGLRYLDAIIDAMKQGRTLEIAYHTYWRSEEREHRLKPLCVKLFRQRWYFVGRSMDDAFTGIFCLDRICRLELGEERFVYPEDFSPETFFAGCFGIIANHNKPIERVVIKAKASQANYLRDLPLHRASQRETERGEEYSTFELYVRPTFDFVQELLWNGDAIEVVEPQSLREEMGAVAAALHEKYRSTDKE